MDSMVLVAVVVVTALAFDFTNGFHDTANAMATSIATGALKPRIAVALSGVLNVLGAFLSLAVATTIAKGIVDAGAITTATVFAGLVGAIVWNLVTWYFGLPSSSSHALIGGVVGATLVSAGPNAVNVAGIVSKVLVPAVASPIIAGVAALAATYLALRITSRLAGGFAGRGFRYGQIASASMVSLAHGTNDAQKTMGVITLALITSGTISKSAGVPLWVIIVCGLAMGAGTYLGGWRVIRTLGKGLTEITAPQGFSAQSAASTVILAASSLGFPLSTTHVCSGAIVGSGVGRKLSEVRWNVAARMAVAWLITLPVAGAVGALAATSVQGLGGAPGVIVVGVVVVVFSLGIWMAARRNRIHAGNVNDPRPDGDLSALEARAA